jgi:hypothetical protein
MIPRTDLSSITRVDQQTLDVHLGPNIIASACAWLGGPPNVQLAMVKYIAGHPVPNQQGSDGEDKLWHVLWYMHY